MTTADRVNARGRSLFDWGVLPPNGRRLSPRVPGRAAFLSTAEQREGEYTTYAPKGEKCRCCGGAFKSLERVRRVLPSGVPNGRPYAHLECLSPEGAG